MSDLIKKRNALMVGVATYAMLISPAVAQDASTEPNVVADEVETIETTEEADDSGRQDKVVVTGSLLRKNEFTSSSPIQVITAEMSTLEGLVDTGEILQGSSVAAGSVQFNNKFGTYLIEGGTGINSISLRGLGAQRSLVLLNSRRPGPAGTGGSVGPFDLNVIPASAIQRVEILKDGASSIYGSDAVAGVANIITMTSLEKPELTVQYNQPVDGGAESLTVYGGFGLNFDTGNIMVTGQYQTREPLKIKDRDFLQCTKDLAFDPTSGASIDQEDRSVIGRTSLGGCNNVWVNTVYDQWNYGTYFVPSPTGDTVGPLDGYEPGQYNAAFRTTVDNHPLYQETDVYNAQELASIYATSSFDLPAAIVWDTEFLYTSRETRYEYGRQFAPLIGSASTQAVYDFFGVPANYAYANDPTYDNPFGGINFPISILPLWSEAKVDYAYIATGLTGDFAFQPIEYFKDWAWSMDLTHSKSDGEYGGLQIIGSMSGDVQYDANSPTYNPYTAAWLGGTDTSWWDDVTDTHWGNTEYTQSSFNAVVTGDLFSLPAGEVAIALGTEWRKFELDDQPSEYSVNGDLWNYSTGLPTKGEDDVVEWFAEVEVPIVKGVPGFESLSVSGSARTFNYASYGVDDVWKAGFDWQVIPMLRFRGTKGTSYRAPALYELFLGETSGFASALSDPCIRWGEKSDDNVRTNCANAGIPDNYLGGSTGIEVLSSGGAGNDIRAETSEAETLGMVFSPTFINLSVAVDYFDIEIFDEIANLSAGSILSNCYYADNYPNEYCSLITRNGADHPLDPYDVTLVRSGYVNVNRQQTAGYDVTVRYEHDLDYGNLTVDLRATQTLEESFSLFNPGLESGYDTDKYNGTIGDPGLVGDGSVMFERNDLTFTWSFDYFGPTSNALYRDEVRTYFGQPARYIIDTEAVWTHDLSVRYQQDDWSIVAGIANMFDEKPPVVSASTTSVYGNTPAFAGYDLYGRTVFARLYKQF